MSEATGALRDLPGGLVRVSVRLLPFADITGGAPSNDARLDDGWPLSPTARRNRAVAEAGWTAKDGTGSFDVDPLDPASVATVVDAVQAAADACATASGVPAAPWYAWDVLTPHPQTVGSDVPQDERWVEDATELDVRQRLVRLAGLRGGRVCFRPTTGVDVELDLSARRRRGHIEVRARDPSSDWRGAWTMSQDDPRADAIVRDLTAALAGFAPEGREPGLNVRLEQHDAAEASEQDSAYLFIVGWLVAIAVVVGITLIARLTGVETSVGLIDRAVDDLEHQWPTLVVIGWTSAFPAIAGGFLADSICRRANLGYAVSAWAIVAGAALACAAYLVVQALAGPSWGLAVAVTWLLIAVAVIGASIVRGFRNA